MPIAATLRTGRPLRPLRPQARWALWLAVLVTLALAASAFVIGYTSVSHQWAASSATGAGDQWDHLGAREILMINAACALLLYSGVATGGLTSAAGLAWTAAYVGATMQVGATNAGLGSVLARSAWYLPLELGGLVLAAVAGVYPVTRSVVAAVGHDVTSSSRRPARRAVGGYLAALPGSLALLASGLGLLLVAAVIESALIHA